MLVEVQLPEAAGPAGEALGAFSSAAYFRSLSTRRLGRVLLSAAELPSTQGLVQHNHGALPDGTVVVVDRQSAGRGLS